MAEGMDFGVALTHIQAGEAVARAGWNGKGMYAVLVLGSQPRTRTLKYARILHKLEDYSQVSFRPYFELYTAQGDIVRYTPTTSDILAEDWCVVDPREQRGDK